MTNQDTRRYVAILNKRERFWSKWFKILALKMGYICVPKDYPEWTLKSSTHAESIAKLYDTKSAYLAGKWSGRADAYMQTSREIDEFRAQILL